VLAVWLVFFCGIYAAPQNWWWPFILVGLHFFFPLLLRNATAILWSGLPPLLAWLGRNGWDFANYPAAAWWELLTVVLPQACALFAVMILARSNLFLRLSIERDLITGVQSLNYLDSNGHRLWENVCRENRPCVVLFIDLDDFRKINEELGHAAGDEILATAAHFIVQTIPRARLLARRGGDEFVALVPCQSRAELERMLVELTLTPPLHEDELRITFSIGACWCEYPQGEWDDALEQAEMAMYRAKNSGKKRYQIRDLPLPRSPRASKRVPN